MTGALQGQLMHLKRRKETGDRESWQPSRSQSHKSRSKRTIGAPLCADYARVSSLEGNKWRVFIRVAISFGSFESVSGILSRRMIRWIEVSRSLRSVDANSFELWTGLPIIYVLCWWIWNVVYLKFELEVRGWVSNIMFHCSRLITVLIFEGWCLCTESNSRSYFNGTNFYNYICAS